MLHTALCALTLYGKRTCMGVFVQNHLGCSRGERVCIVQVCAAGTAEVVPQVQDNKCEGA